MKKFLLLVLNVITLQIVIAQNTWTRKADFGGTERTYAAGFSIGTKGYLGTGSDAPGHVYTKDFWEYDPSANTWTQKADFGGTARRGAVGFSIGAKGYIGTGVDNNGFTKDFWEYDPSANTWTRKADFGGTARREATGFSIGAKGYIGTGASQTFQKDFWEYDPSANTWTQKVDFGGTARYAATGFSIGTKGYIGTGFGSSSLRDFWEYDPSANSWIQKADFAGVSRGSATGFSLGTKGYLGTGLDIFFNTRKDFWEYDPSANVWYQKTNFGGTERFAATSFSIGTKGFTGTGGAGLTATKDFWEYTPSTMQNVTTNNVSAITTMQATLNATVNANNSPTTVSFEYGTTSTYGNSIAGSPSPVSGNVNTAVSATITSLAANTLYHARVVGQNAAGTTYGDDVAFYTLANTPTAPVVSNPTNTTLTVAISGGDGNPSNTMYSILETRTNKYVQLDGSLGTTPVFQTASAWSNKTVAGLLEGITYTFVLNARNGDNKTTASGPSASGTTLGQVVAPTATTGSATVIIGVSNPYALLFGTVNANGSSTSFSFEFGTTTTYGRSVSANPSTVTGNSNTSISSEFIFALQGNQNYHYRIVAQNSGVTIFGADATFYVPLFAPFNPYIRNETSTTLDVGYTPHEQNSGSTTYAIYETTTGKYVQPDGTLGTAPLFGIFSRTVRGLSPNTTYSFVIIAKGDNGATRSSSPTSGTTLKLPTVTTDAPGSITANSAELRATVNANGRSANVGFQYGKTTAYGSGIFATNVTGNSNTPVAKVVTGLEANQLYHYRIYAQVIIQSVIDDARGNDVTFYTLANTPTAPVVSNPTSSTLTIAVSAGDGNPSNTTYAIHETTTNKYVQADGLLGTTPVFQTASAWGTKTVTGLSPATTYNFEVKARNGDNVETMFSPSASATTSGQSQPAITTYYPKTGSSDLSVPSNWTSDPAGDAGSSPANFISLNQLFVVNTNVAIGVVSQPWTISGGSNVTLQNRVVVQVNGRITVGTGSTFDFNNQLVTIRSSASGTGSIGTITGTITNATNVVAERFIPARRAWRMTSSAVASGQSINAAWQEGATTASPNPNPNPGFGTHITGGSVAQGFDQSPSNSSSIKTYDNATDNWLPLPNTNATPVSSNVFMLFVRGDRSIDLTRGTAAAPTNTVLRANGSLRTGDQTFTVNATGFTPIPNPYPSAINFATITKNNVQNSFYVWDPKMSGPDGVGAFVNVSFNGSTYDVTPAPASPISQYIQSHQSFLVRSTGAAGSLVIKETDKSTGGSDNVFRTGSVSQSFRVNLMVNNADNTTSIADGVLSSYSTDFSDAIDDMDAVKMTNFNENIGIARKGQTLTVERRSAVSSSDTIFLKLWNTTEKSYRLQFDPANFSSSAIASYLIDNYLNTSTPVSMSSISDVEFTVTADAASSAPDRFMIVFKANSTLPVNFTTIKAYQQSNNVQVDWNVGTETNTVSYEIEKSSDGVMFTKAGTVAAKANNNAAVAYNWIDVAPYVGNNYYRIKAVTLTGEVKYTQVVNVKTAKGRSEITAYPNPLAGRTINVQLVNQQAGTYNVELINNIGQVMYRNQIKHLGGSSSQTLNFNNKLAKGVYQLKISNGDTKKAIQIISN